MRGLCSCILMATIVGFAPTNLALADDLDLISLEEAAFRQAVADVEPSVVRIETIGGLERVGEMLVGTGPTTGLIVSKDGYIISSAFNFVQKPASVLIGLADGTRKPAKIVATDHSRMLVLLKIEVDEPLPVPKATPKKETLVGNWAIAVGRTFEANHLNRSVGIVSAVDRVWGRAIQTDAKVSPVNYGGPLIDIQGRVLGILVPLSPQQDSKVGGVEWYDSGIGFAIPLVDVFKALNRLKEGDLYPGVMGISLKAGHQFADPAVIAVVRANSPAYEAGLKAGDTIIQINNARIIRQSQVKEQVSKYYADDVIHVVATRDGERIEGDLKLAKELTPYERPFIGALPLRVAATEEKADDKDAKEDDKQEVGPTGVPVRYIYPESGAAKAGMLEGDVIVRVADKPIDGIETLRTVVADQKSDAAVKIEILREGKPQTLEVTTGVQPEEIPEKLPAARAEGKPYLGEQPPVGRQAVQVAEFKNECLLVVPESYDPSIAYGLVVWVDQPGALETDEAKNRLVTQWKPLCEKFDLIFMAPRPAEAQRWSPPSEIPFISKAIEQVRGDYNLDTSRILAIGSGAGGAMAYALAFAEREVLRGVAAVNAPVAGRPPENDPILSLFFLSAANAQRAEQINKGLERLRTLKFPVTELQLDEGSDQLSAEQLGAVLRWFDTFDRF